MVAKMLAEMSNTGNNNIDNKNSGANTDGQSGTGNNEDNNSNNNNNNNEKGGWVKAAKV